MDRLGSRGTDSARGAPVENTDGPLDDGRGLTRRALLAVGFGSAITVGLGLVGPPSWLRVAAASPLQAADPATALLEAYASTLVPGPADDPLGTPGAVEAGAVEAMRRHVPYVIPLLAADVTGAALAAHGKPFAALTYSEREALVVEALADDSRSPYHLIALAIGAGAFYGDFVNRVGGTHLGFPGPSAGYLDTYTDRTGHGQPQREAVPS